MAQSETNPNLPEDRPRQIPNESSDSPSQKATQKFFFRKQVHSIDNGGSKRGSLNST